MKSVDMAIPRHADIAVMLKRGETAATIMGKHSCSYVLIQRIQSQEGIAKRPTGPRVRMAELTTDHDRGMYGRQQGKCWFCEAGLQDWKRIAGRDGTAVALVCNVCLDKAHAIVWDDVFCRNLQGLRALHPTEVAPPEVPHAVGANYKARNGPAVYERKSAPGQYLVEIGPGKYAPVDEKFVIFPA